jgi:GTP cyclohydrolase I
VTLNMPADILRELTRDDASARRVAAALSELLTPDDFELTTFADEQGYDQLVLARDIPFRSLCQHQMLPFYGVAHSGASGNTRTLAKLWAKQIPSGVYRRDVTVAVS